MKLLYLDESGSTGTDLENKQQPFFVLAGVYVEDKNWHSINDYFEQEKIRICPDLATAEIHTNELFNSTPKSIFYKNYWKDNFIILEQLISLVSSLDIKVINATIYKKAYKKHFGNNIIVDPYLYSFAIIYHNFNNTLFNLKDYGIIFCDELKKIESSLEILYPRLKVENKNIIEKTFYLNSKKNNFIQIADLCSFYINKYNCIKRNMHTLDTFKSEHCIKMYQKLSKILETNSQIISLDNLDNYFR